MARPFVSVLIDTYNHERFIEQAICSVQEQDFPLADREIVIVDDGSTDRTPDILQKFSKDARILRKSNGGQASAFNHGLANCSGEVIAFLDGDDFWCREKLATVVSELNAQPAIGAVGHGIFQTDETGRQMLVHAPASTVENHLRSRAEALEFLTLRACLGTSRLTMRRTTIGKFLPVPSDLVIEADEYLFTCAAAFDGVRILPLPLTNYRLHSSNLYQSRNPTPQSLLRKRTSLDSLISNLPSRLASAGVPAESISSVIDSISLDADRLRLGLGHGSPLDTFQVERRAFRQSYRSSTFGYRLFHLAVLAAAAILPPKLFYALRHKYATVGLHRIRRIIGSAEPVDSLVKSKVLLP
jgi:glycosyltransferase involved in cell wall biosynthesis